MTTFAYNAQGLVSQITDPEGRIITLTYDADGHLLSVTAPQGTTSYTYVTSGPQEQNALASVTNPDGTQVIFTYNVQGQLIGESQNGGADPLTFGYNLGAITETDALGDTTTLFLDDAELSPGSWIRWAISLRERMILPRTHLAPGRGHGDLDRLRFTR